jgi:tight adherence protein C
VLYLTVVTVALAVALGVAFVLEAMPSRPRGVSRRLAEIEILGSSGSAVVARRRRLSRREGFAQLLADLGNRIPTAVVNDASLTQLLRQAGYDGERAALTFWGVRLGVTASLGALAALVTTLLVARSSVVVLVAVYCALMGWVLPFIWVRRRRARRQKEMTRALPDVLDFLVVCVEAGLGLNQALVRVSQEIGAVSRELGKELAFTNLQIRAGTARSDALQDLADRTGLSEIQSLVTTLVQTDRFGTSVARSLRVHAETLRQKRRQAAEEAAAKTTIKMVFPLVVCIFPALFVVLLSPGLIRILQTFGDF